MFFGKKFHGHQMMDLSGLDILVLSIIKNNPRISGYDISQKLKRKFRGMWKASPGTIYPLLSRLAEKGYLEIEETVENNRQKKLYIATQGGIDRLKENIEDNLRNSIDTLGDFVNTIVKAFPIKVGIDDCFCGWPSHGSPEPEKIDKDDYSPGNIKNIGNILERLEKSKLRFQGKLESIDKHISEYKDILKRLNEDKKKYTKEIEIIDGDEEFEDF